MTLKVDSESQRADVVFDTCQDMSIKLTEQKLRERSQVQLKNITRLQTIQKLRSSLSNTENKSNLIAFPVRE